jgi:CopG family transcriptional regulator, nickel-responsive regulator
MKTIKRFGVSLEEELLKELDAFVKKHQLPNRSQAIRHLIRKNLVEDAWGKNKEVSGAVVLIFDHHKKEVVNKSLDIQHEYCPVILATQHVHLDHHNCLEIIALKGKARVLKELSDRLISLKGVKHGQLVISASENSQ